MSGTNLPAGLLDRLLAPSAITIVGASPNGHITNHLLRNLESPSCRFRGPIHLVNPNYRRIFDRDCIAGVEDLPGDPGLVYLLLRPEACLPALEALRLRPDGVILFPDGSPSPGGYEETIADWGLGKGVGVLGPQSNGLVSLPGRVHGLLIPVVEDLIPGPVAILAQSGGVLGGMVKYLAQRGIGLHAALEYGTACMLPPEELAPWLLARSEVRMLAIYADGVASIERFAAVLELARAAGKAVVFMVGGGSAAGGRAVASHSGMAATPRRVLDGIARQHGAILARNLDELVWSIEALHAVGYARPSGDQVALFSDSGGGAIAIADALDAQGVGLAEPNAEAKAGIGRRFGAVNNPFDFGSASMGQVREQAEDVGAVAADARYGVFVFASTIGLGLREQSVHISQLEEFRDTVDRLGRVPFIASPFPFDEDLPPGSRAVLGRGSTESAVKVRALTTWADPGAALPARAGGEPASIPEDEPSLAVVSGEAARKLLGGLPLEWPAEGWLTSLDELAGLPELRFPLVLKTEAGLAHRARAGGVLSGIGSKDDLRNAATYLLGRFGGAVSVAEFVPHQEEYFLGAYRDGPRLLLLFGAGGTEAESADVRLAPLSHAQIADFTRRHAPAHAEGFAALLAAFQAWTIGSPWAEAVDLNPIVVSGGRLVALDAKIHGRAP